MPSLKDDSMGSTGSGVSYVGMIKPVTTDYEYILTDIRGNIDSFSSGIGSLLNLNPALFKEGSNINI